MTLVGKLDLAIDHPNKRDSRGGGIAYSKITTANHIFLALEREQMKRFNVSGDSKKSDPEPDVPPDGAKVQRSCAQRMRPSATMSLPLVASRRIYGIVLLLIFLYVVIDNVWSQSRSKPPIVSSNPAGDKKSPSTLEKKGTDSESSLFNRLEIYPRAFLPWNIDDNPLPCFEPEKDWLRFKVGDTASREGFLFIKVPKTASSTGAGINLRVAHGLARRRNFEICKNRFRHGYARDFEINERDKNKSFAWSIVRDPTARIISEFFHFEVARGGTEPTDENFIKFLEETGHVHDYQLRYLALERIKSPAYAIKKILNGYDFVGVTERMDESAVAIQMLLGLDTSDIMSVSSAKSNGGYDDGAYDDTCFRIPKSFVSSRVKDYFQSRYWKKIVFWDEILHQAVNKSLDMTIERLGSAEFQRNLKIYQQTKKEVEEYCSNKVTFPCSSTGVRTEKGENDCLHEDSGCGFECMDEYFRQHNTTNGSFGDRLNPKAVFGMMTLAVLPIL